MEMVYLDNAATTPVRPEVLQKLCESIAYFGNPSSTHYYGRKSKALLEKARKNIARELGIQASELIFTSGGSEGNTMLLFGAVRKLGITHIISSAIEHTSVLDAIQTLSDEYGISTSQVRILANGEVDLIHLEYLLSQMPENEKTLVSLMHINNEIGTILRVEKVSELCKYYDAFFHCDMVQSIGHYSLNLNTLGVDMATASAHKFYGVKGAGFVFIKKHLGMKAHIYGGEQERGLRGGTEALPNIIAMEEAFLLAQKNLANDQVHITELKNYFVHSIKNAIEGVTFNGESDDVSSHSYAIVNVSLPTSPKKSEVALLYLDMNGVACSKGSACQSGSVQNSYVLRQFLPKERYEQTNLRFSFSIFNKKEEIDQAIRVLKSFTEEK